MLLFLLLLQVASGYDQYSSLSHAGTSFRRLLLQLLLLLLLLLQLLLLSWLCLLLLLLRLLTGHVVVCSLAASLCLLLLPLLHPRGGGEGQGRSKRGRTLGVAAA